MASIIISNNEPKALLPLNVHILCRQTFAGEYEVLLPLLQEPPLDDLAILLDFEKRYPHFHIIPIENNRAIALNQAAKMARGKWLFFVESHCVMQDNWLETYLLFLEARTAVAAVGSIQDLPSNNITSQSEAKNRADSPIFTTPFFFDLHNSALLKETFLKMNGFSPSLPILGEFDLGARLHAQGIPIERFTHSIVLHKNSTSLFTYLITVGRNGEDRMKLIFERDPQFIRNYFPNPFLNLWRYIKPIRPLFLLAAFFLIGFAQIGFAFCNLFKLEYLGWFFFTQVSKNVHRLGYLKAMKEARI
jgi:GT2 family glycosyltransferase